DKLLFLYLSAHHDRRVLCGAVALCTCIFGTLLCFVSFFQCFGLLYFFGCSSYTQGFGLFFAPFRVRGSNLYFGKVFSLHGDGIGISHAYPGIPLCLRFTNILVPVCTGNQNFTIFFSSSYLGVPVPQHL